MKWLWIFLGGGLGSLLRYRIGISTLRYHSPFPWTTTSANILASLLLGILAVRFYHQHQQSPYLFGAVGFCGGLSTFSTFAHELILLLAQGQWKSGMFYLLLNLLLSLAAVVVGYLIGSTLNLNT